MKRIMILAICLAFLCGCATGKSHISANISEEEKMPERVGVFPFSGTQPYSGHATDLFSMGLLSIPQFKEVVERNKISEVMRELDFQHSGAVDEKTVMKLGKQLGLDAMFVGNLVPHKETIQRVTAHWINTKVTVKLISVETGVILWGCNARDDRVISLTGDLSTSAEVAVKNALRMLKRDLKRMR